MALDTARGTRMPRPRNGNETARGHVVAGVPRASAREAVGLVRDRLMRERYDAVDIVLVTDDEGRYVGAATIGDVLTGRGDAPLSDLARRDWPSAPLALDQEQAVELATTAGVTMLPVLDADGRPIGCIPASAMLEVLAAEHHEDVHRMAGIVRESAHNRHALEDPPLRRFRLRLPWLLVGLALSTAGTAVMAGFEETLKRHIAVAFFIPALVYLTDAIGTQTEAIAVRGLSVTRKPLLEIFLKEIATGMLIGATLGVLALVGIWATFADLRLAAGVGLSLLVGGTIASAIGLALPWGLSRIGIDPALGSGPVATIIQDVLTLLVYFTILSLALQGL